MFNSALSACPPNALPFQSGCENHKWLALNTRKTLQGQNPFLMRTTILAVLLLCFLSLLSDGIAGMHHFIGAFKCEKLKFRSASRLRIEQWHFPKIIALGKQEDKSKFESSLLWIASSRKAKAAQGETGFKKKIEVFLFLFLLTWSQSSCLFYHTIHIKSCLLSKLRSF